MSSPKRNTNNKNSSNQKKKINKGLLFYIKAFFKKLLWNFRKFLRQIFYSDFFKDGKKKFLGTYVFIISIFAILVFLLTKKNSYGVYLGDNLIGYIPYIKNLEKSEISNLAISKIQSEVKSNIKVNEELNLKKAHASKKEILSNDEIASELRKKYTYQIEGSAIYINDKLIGILKNDEEINETVNKIAEKYTGTNQLISVDFVEKKEVVKQFVSLSELTSKDILYDLLTTSKKEEISYVIKSGDVLDRIAINNGLETDTILDLNPGLTRNTILKIGQSLNIISNVPLLSIKTTEEVKNSKVIKYEIETRENSSENERYKNILQIGKDGEGKDIIHITKINGIEQSREIIGEEITTPSITEIIEIGTEK